MCVCGKRVFTKNQQKSFFVLYNFLDSDELFIFFQHTKKTILGCICPSRFKAFNTQVPVEIHRLIWSLSFAIKHRYSASLQTAAAIKKYGKRICCVRTISRVQEN